MAPELETTLWKAWAGFNLSHALGVMVISLTIEVPAIVDFDAALQNLGWLAVALVAPPVYLVISLRYWFRDPTIGIGLGIAPITAGTTGSWLT